MRLDGRGADAQELGNLSVRPLVAVDQHDGNALVLGEPSEGAGEPRLDPWLVPPISWVKRPELPSPRAALAYPVEIPEGIRELVETLSVFPGPGEGCRGRFPSPLRSERGRERSPQSRLDGEEELLERSVTFLVELALLNDPHTELEHRTKGFHDSRPTLSGSRRIEVEPTRLPRLVE